MIGEGREVYAQQLVDLGIDLPQKADRLLLGFDMLQDDRVAACILLKFT